MELAEILAYPGRACDMAHVEALMCEFPEKPGVYLFLCNGRATPEEDMDDWGTDGPYFGPLTYVHCSYMSEIQFGDKEGGIAIGTPLYNLGFQLYRSPLFLWEGLIYFDGVFYGDWNIFVKQ